MKLGKPDRLLPQCGECGRAMTNGKCASCVKDRLDGEAFVAQYGGLKETTPLDTVSRRQALAGVMANAEYCSAIRARIQFAYSDKPDT